MTEKENLSIYDLMELAKLLRDPVKGCPWDKDQTFDSFKKNLVDEAEEAVKAIEKNDFKNLEEELGDTLFNLIFLINLAEEKELFTLNSVIRRIYEKMISRHPHVFGEKKAKNAEEALLLFLEAKKKEKNVAMPN